MEKQDHAEARRLKVGSTFVIEGEELRMVVEDILFGHVAPSARCIWFDDDDALHFEDIALSRLSCVDASTLNCSTRRGDEVRLRSIGPVMTVLREEYGLMLCEWDGPMGMVRRRHFPVEALCNSIMDAI
jgi:uncharacterized protein YodC (DUF2158 family)